MEIYRAETALSASEKVYEELRAAKVAEELAAREARTRWGRLRETLRVKMEGFRVADARVREAKAVLEEAQRSYDVVLREKERIAVEVVEVERDNAEAEVDLARSEGKLGTREEAIAVAKWEVDRLTKIAEEKIKLLKLPF